MPHLHYRTIATDLVGSANGAVETIGTIETSSLATDICAFVLGKANSGVRTAAETFQGEFIINPGELSKDLLTIQSGVADGGGPATQIQGFVEYPKWVPYKPTTTESVAKKQIIFQYDSTIEGTAEHCAQVSVVYAEGPYPTDVMQNVEDLVTPITWAGSTTEPDAGNAVLEAFPDTIVVPGWVDEIVAVGITISPDAILTTAQHWVSYVEITGTIEGLDPMQIPISTIHAALAGTCVVKGVICNEYILPMYIDIKSSYPKTLYFTYNTDAIHSLGAVTVTLYGRKK